MSYEIILGYLELKSTIYYLFCSKPVCKHSVDGVQPSILQMQQPFDISYLSIWIDSNILNKKYEAIDSLYVFTVIIKTLIFKSQFNYNCTNVRIVFGLLDLRFETAYCLLFIVYCLLLHINFFYLT